MYTFLWACFIYLFVWCAADKDPITHDLTGNESICDKSYFISNYVNKSLPFTMNLFHKLGNCFPYNGTGANSNLLKAMYIQQEATKLFYFYVEVVRLMEFTYPGEFYWGNILIVNDNNSTRTNYYNFYNEKKNSFSLLIPAVIDFTYNITLLSVPYSTSPLRISLKAPSKCGNFLLKVITNKIQNEKMFRNCLNDPGFAERATMANEVCQMHPGNQEKQIGFVKKYIINKNCELYADTPSQEEKDSEITPLIIMSVVSGVSLLVIFVGVITYYLRWRAKKVPEEPVLPHRSNYDHLLHLKDIKLHVYNQ
ncbi:uncharacterized protein LOC130654737 isoform X1 [Hydractinia symbiolongicarpus]|uniref:uncharacterized protein LOC130654737 isoform X1 n=1 Tax=Hydractinia symbiolongicarpus TaxID=13093 RepID=UPI00254F5839|nr:uncharacterized protein LOC130654737 isoform X1 [Hydractinia symbiolongicarpus]